VTLTRALVTGAAGFVGANLVRRLVSDGVETVACTRPGTSAWRLDDLEGLETVELDLLDRRAISAALEREKPDAVFHLAAHGAYAWQTDRRRIALTNFVAFVDLLDACEAVGTHTIVNTGSSSEYGTRAYPPREDEWLDPNSDYAVSKAAATLFGRHVSRTRELSVATLRLYSAYGPWEEPRRLVPALLVAGLQGSLPPLVDGAIARDFVHVDDVVDALIVAATKAPAGSVYNVASGRQTTIAEVVEVARRLFQIDEEPRWGSMKPRSWDTDAWVGDPSQIAADLGWHPARALEEGLRGTAEWLLAHPQAWSRYGLLPGRASLS
jgi:dolichol-phosphate mannosyltransferase